jgi:uncharacterized FlaG/YvyC family protein
MEKVAPVSAVAPGSVSGSGTSNGVSSSERAFNNSVSTAVRTLNESGVAGQDREVTFSLDRATRRPVVQVVDINTKEVIDQWPPEYALRLAQMNSNGAQIHDESILRTNDTVG